MAGWNAVANAMRPENLENLNQPRDAGLGRQEREPGRRMDVRRTCSTFAVASSTRRGYTGT